MDKHREPQDSDSDQGRAKLPPMSDPEQSRPSDFDERGGRLRFEGHRGDTAGSQPNTSAALVWSLVLSVLKFKRGTFQRIGSDPISTKPAIAVYGIAFALPLLASLFQPDFFAEIDQLAESTALPNVVRDFYQFLGGLAPSAALPLIVMDTFATAVALLLVHILILRSLFWFSGRNVPTFRAWFAAFAFASAPNPLSAVPMVGPAVAGVYIALLEIAAIRELARISIGQAVLYWFGTFILPGIVIVVVMLVYGAAAA